MDGRKIIGVGLGSLLWLGCGGFSDGAVDTDTDTDTEGRGDDARGETSGDDASASDPTADSMSGGATSSDPSGAATTDSGAGTTGGAGEESAGSEAGSGGTGECPVGSEGCLCDVGATCERGLECDEDGTCVGPGACRPIDTEPHDDEASAVEFEELGCDEGVELDVIGTIEGPQTDWYRFPGNASGFCLEQPVAIAAAEDPLEVCVFLECSSGGDVQDLACGEAATEAESPEGRPGCCGEGLAFVEDYDCSGFGGKDAEVFISVGSADEICVDYALEYGF